MGNQLKIGKRRQQGRGSTGKEYLECPNCREFYLRGMYILDRNTSKSIWIKIGLYCEGCGASYSFLQKEKFLSAGLSYEI